MGVWFICNGMQWTINPFYRNTNNVLNLSSLWVLYIYIYILGFWCNEIITGICDGISWEWVGNQDSNLSYKWGCISSLIIVSQHFYDPIHITWEALENKKLLRGMYLYGARSHREEKWRILWNSDDHIKGSTTLPLATGSSLTVGTFW